MLLVQHAVKFIREDEERKAQEWRRYLTEMVGDGRADRHKEATDDEEELKAICRVYHGDCAGWEGTYDLEVSVHERDYIL